MRYDRAIPMKSLLRLIKRASRHYGKHNASRMGAALSYYAIFSIAPLTILIIALVGSIFGTQLAESSIVNQLDRVIGSGAGDFIDAIITSTSRHTLGTIGTIASIVTILLGSISVLSVLDTSLDELWETKTQKENEPQPFFRRVWSAVQRKFPAFSLIPIMALLFLFFIAISVFLSLYQENFGGVPGFAIMANLIEPVALFLFGTAFFAFIYRILPDSTLPTRAILLGAIVTSALFLLGRIIIGLYIAHFANTTLYGAAASLVALLIWIYYSAQVFFYGASLTYVYAKKLNK